MARRPRVRFSGQNLELPWISQHHQDVEAAVRDYFSLESARLKTRFIGYTADEIRQEMTFVLEENERTTAMNILAALEAAFRVDFLQRCYRRGRDPLSRAFRAIHDRKGSQAALEEDIFLAWKQNSTVSASLMSELTGAFKYRHWLAHGRYWVPRLGKRYDYQTVYLLAESVFESFPFKEN